MNKTLAFMKLDFITVKPYFSLKNLLPFLFIVAFFSFTTDGGGAMAVFSLVIWSVVFASYPFAVGEQNGIDALYCTLSVSRENVVAGRYLYALCIDVLGAALAFALTVLVRALRPLTGDLLAGDPFNFAEHLGALCLAVFALSVVQALQIPIYFKLGYTKAKFMAYLPLVLFSAVVGAGTFLFKEGLGNAFGAVSGFFEAHTASAVLIMLGVWLFAMFVSYLFSLSFYRRREF